MIFLNFLSGGTLGLFTGMSILSMVEVVYWVIKSTFAIGLRKKIDEWKRVFLRNTIPFIFLVLGLLTYWFSWFTGSLLFGKRLSPLLLYEHTVESRYKKSRYKKSRYKKYSQYKKHFAAYQFLKLVHKESRYKKKSRYKKPFAADQQISYIEILLYEWKTTTKSE